MGETTGELVEINAARQHLSNDLDALKNHLREETRPRRILGRHPLFLIAAATVVGLFLLGFTTGRLMQR